MISPHAIIDPKAQLGEGVHVGPFSIIGPNVSIGDHTQVGPHVVINGPCQIGSHNQIFQFSSIGEAPQDKKYRGEPTQLLIGDHNVIRESVTIHRGTVQDAGLTKIGNHNLLMAGMHVAHDCVIGDHTVIANNVALAGHVIVNNHVLIGGGAAISQFNRVGVHAFVGGMTAVVGKDVPPFVKVTGPKAQLCGLNVIGLQRAGFDSESIAHIRQAYKILYRQNLLTQEACDKIAALDCANTPSVQQFLHFVQETKQGILR